MNLLSAPQPVRNNLLTFPMIARDALRICANALGGIHLNVDEYVIGTMLGGQLKQRYVNILFNENDLALSLDAFCDKRLSGPLSDLGAQIKADGAFWSFALPITKDGQCCTNRYEGLNMRMVTVETELDPKAWLAVFDVLYLTKAE